MKEAYELNSDTPKDPKNIPPVQPRLEEIPEVVPTEKEVDITTIDETLDKVRKGWTPKDDVKNKKGPTYH